MKINIEKLSNAAAVLKNDIGGYCCEASLFIGEVDGVVFQLVALSQDEAIDKEFEIIDDFDCIKPSTPDL